MAEDTKWVDHILKLYEIYSNDLKKYTTIIWQFPTALVGVNILAIDHLMDKPRILLFIALVNFSLLFALYRHIRHQGVIIDSLIVIEKKLRYHFYSRMIAEFKRKKFKATYLVWGVLLIFNIVFLYFTFKWSFLDC